MEHITSEFEEVKDILFSEFSEDYHHDEIKSHLENIIDFANSSTLIDVKNVVNKNLQELGFETS